MSIWKKKDKKRKPKSWDGGPEDTPWWSAILSGSANSNDCDSPSDHNDSCD